ncbi:hypothetical protein E2C01_027866 [Portunus trituberculatus]|uniref:Uncharacterized protein n=1 Tax=Portunus trituberculatus TaxID=210409 RepID=A0A5B7EM26_PORTR|nr:hypothetical protein [Portunus trituberculatus]
MLILRFLGVDWQSPRMASSLMRPIVELHHDVNSHQLAYTWYVQADSFSCGKCTHLATLAKHRPHSSPGTPRSLKPGMQSESVHFVL